MTERRNKQVNKLGVILKGAACLNENWMGWELFFKYSPGE
jgi:hypothetical protein